jgi:hypothetical protein
VQPVACDKHDKAAHDEEHDSEVEDKHGISEELVGHDRS